VAGNLTAIRSAYATVLAHRWLLFDVGGTVGASVMAAMALVVTLRHTGQLYREEPLP
jgi:archaetidylinositol phosphate synthase